MIDGITLLKIMTSLWASLDKSSVLPGPIQSQTSLVLFLSSKSLQSLPLQYQWQITQSLYGNGVSIGTESCLVYPD